MPSFDIDSLQKYIQSLNRDTWLRMIIKMADLVSHSHNNQMRNNHTPRRNTTRPPPPEQQLARELTPKVCVMNLPPDVFCLPIRSSDMN